VKIALDADSSPSGAGVYLGNGYVLTCAHVLLRERTDTSPTSPVYVAFQWHDADQPLTGCVVNEGWHPEAPENRADIAILRLKRLFATERGSRGRDTNSSLT
jgi:hypothetical protein